MKSKLSHFALPTAALCWLLSVAATGCIATAFQLQLANGMSFSALLLGLFAGLVCVTFARSRLSVPIFLFLCAQLLLLFSLKGNLEQMQTLLPTITQYYNQAYGWPILLENGPFAQYADLALLQLGLTICFFLSWLLMRRRPLLLCLLPLTPLLCCIVVYDTVPSGLYLFLLLLGLVILRLTHSARRKGVASIGAQSIKLTPIAALFLAAIFVLAPSTEALNPVRTYASRLAPWIEELIQSNSNLPTSGTGSSSSNVIDLSTLGPRTQDHSAVLYATSSKSGLTYLRQKVMGQYTGYSWEIDGGSSLFGSADAPATGSISIRTMLVLRYQYVPYFPASTLTFHNGLMSNTGKERTYSFETSDHYHTYATINAIYKNLPDTTLRWANQLLASLIDDSLTRTEKAAAIAQYVQNSAQYSLNTKRMPTSSQDFAQWFLEDSSTGYCVHFATAAAVLLRAAGIPAVYVEGMTFRAEANKEVKVTNANAHAWVEYFNYDTYTWEIMDPTPASGIPGGDSSGDTPDTPDTPNNPGTPDTPDTPDAPDTPDTPDQPDTPDTPDGPAQPDTPDLPIMTPDDYAKEDWRVWLSLQPWPVIAGLICAGAVLLMLLQALLRQWYHRYCWTHGTTNQQALQRFRQCRMLAKLLRTELPQQLTDVAQKARFSQYTLHAQELVCYDEFLSDSRIAGAGAPIHRRLVRALIAAL